MKKTILIFLAFILGICVFLVMSEMLLYIVLGELFLLSIILGYIKYKNKK